MPGLLSKLADAVGTENVVAGDELGDDYAHDEALGGSPQMPLAVVRPTSTDQVSRILRFATDHRVPVTARGAASGLSGGCVPLADGIVVSFERMKRIVEIDTENHVAIVEAGVTLAELNTALEPLGSSTRSSRRRQRDARRQRRHQRRRHARRQVRRHPPQRDRPRSSVGHR